MRPVAFLALFCSLQELSDSLSEAESRIDSLGRQRKQLEQEKDSLKANIQDLETTVKKQVSWCVFQSSPKQHLSHCYSLYSSYALAWDERGICRNKKNKRVIIKSARCKTNSHK